MCVRLSAVKEKNKKQKPVTTNLHVEQPPPTHLSLLLHLTQACCAEQTSTNPGTSAMAQAENTVN